MAPADGLKARVHAGLTPELYSYLVNVQLMESGELSVRPSELILLVLFFTVHIGQITNAIGACVILFCSLCLRRQVRFVLFCFCICLFLRRMLKDLKVE